MSKLNSRPTTVKQVNRRQFLATTAKAGCAMGLIGLGLTTMATSQGQLAPQACRPPGALEEADFLSACVRCGLCVNACPEQAITLG